ncbi:hypothetical protein GQR60_16190 [Labilibaculum sp. A4]|uniref:hypothetical protein n=1 Tax=Labilibaculum euxinus TaxID=2686357 RepID=UPI000F6284C3|nr:hypothetical protein [Labilibaculum euxinus]MDQ1772178.1 hypothetical protein [Labilibaculum euxinus]MWN77880.1 hypothetical protein [Labilibaculum euxinus]
MKILLSIIILITSNQLLFSQLDTTSLLTTKEYLNSSFAVNNFLWSGMSLGQNIAKDLDKTVFDISNFDKKNIDSLDEKYKGQYELVLENKEAIKEYIEESGLFLADYFYYSSNFIPSFFTVDKEGELTIIFSGLWCREVYNIQKLSSKERVAEIITNHVLPSLNYLIKHFRNSKIMRFGFICTYGSKDPYDSSTSSLEGESVAFITSIDKRIRRW